MINRKYVVDFIKHSDYKDDFKGLKIKQRGRVKDRLEFLKEKVKGKKVIHLGCVDHESLMQIYIKNNIWAHKVISDNADKCIGIDINEEGIRLLKNKYLLENIYFSDILEEDFEPILEEKWDYIILGELIEHIGNPKLFLDNLILRYKHNIKNVIITTPNAFAISNFVNALKGVERINSDHRYYFTPYTLWKVCNDANIELLDMEILEHHKIKFKTLNGEASIFNSFLLIFYKIFIRLFPMTRNTIVAVFKINRH